MVRGRAPKASEQIAMAALQRLWPRMEVEVHDDGTAPGMYDLHLSGAFEAAAEVAEITNSVTRAAHGHWDKNLRGQASSLLGRCWTFVFTQEVTPGDEPSSYPFQPRPPTDRIEAVLANLESRGITQLGRLSAYIAPDPQGFSWSDPDVGELVQLVGQAADGLSSYPAPPDNPGGWTFAFGHHTVSRVDANGLSSEIESRLAAKPLADLRTKLGASSCPVRIAILVYDTTTSIGWSFGHWEPALIPTRPMTLPSEVTSVVIVGLNDFTLIYSSTDGWQRRPAE